MGALARHTDTQVGSGGAIAESGQSFGGKREWFIRLTLLTACVGFWYSWFNAVSFPLLVVACFIDGGLRRFGQALKLPLVQALLMLCALLLVGLSWSELPFDGRMKWLKYFMLLFIIPFYLLLNRQRLLWALAGLAAGYFGVLAMGVYQWQVMGVQGIPWLGMSYLSFSAMLGVGVIVAASFVFTGRSIAGQLTGAIAALALLFIQFHQSGRVLLLATLISVLLMIMLRYRHAIKHMLVIALTVVTVAAVFAFSSPVFQERLALINNDVALLQQGQYNSSLGYRLAMWDVGMHAIAERPWTGYGTGMAAPYFDQAIETYKGEIYKDLPAFQPTSHFHNDWIEIGMHIGVPGMAVLLYLYWGWYRAFQSARMALLGAGLVSFLGLAGLTDTFLIFSRTPILILMITGVALHWSIASRNDAAA